MQESYFKIEFSDVRLSTVWYDNRFNIHESTNDNFSGDVFSRTHSHPSYEVFFVNEGKLWVITETENFLCENSIVIIPPGITHYTLTENALISIIFFTAEKRKEHTKTEVYEKFTEVTKKLPVILPLNSDELFYVSHIAKAQNPGVFNSEQLPHFLSILFSELFSRIVPEKKTTQKKSERYYAHRINLFISSHYKEKLHLQDLADALFLCPKQVTRIIRKEFNCSFNELIMRSRIDIACMTLIRTNLEIAQIAASVGYEYTNLFYSHFKKMYGMTPTEYRARAREKN